MFLNKLGHLIFFFLIVFAIFLKKVACHVGQKVKKIFLAFFWKKSNIHVGRKVNVLGGKTIKQLIF